MQDKFHRGWSRVVDVVIALLAGLVVGLGVLGTLLLALLLALLEQAVTAIVPAVLFYFLYNKMMVPVLHTEALGFWFIYAVTTCLLFVGSLFTSSSKGS